MVERLAWQKATSVCIRHCPKHKGFHPGPAVRSVKISVRVPKPGEVGGAIESEPGQTRPPSISVWSGLLYVCTLSTLPRHDASAQPANQPANARGGSTEWDRAGSSEVRQTERRCDGTTARRKRCAMAPRQPTGYRGMFGRVRRRAIRDNRRCLWTSIASNLHSSVSSLVNKGYGR